MNGDLKPKDETEEIFSEYYEVLEKAERVKSNPEMPQRAIMIEYMQLSEAFGKLLKTAVRISKLGDKAQKKLLKYKEVMDALRNIE